MNCLVELCFLASIYINGGVGIQAYPEFWDKPNYMRTNDYSSRIGEISLVIELDNGLYFEAKHISGVDTAEIDHGLNAIMIGARINLFEGKN
jgi:hypothetical protein